LLFNKLFFLYHQNNDVASTQYDESAEAVFEIRMKKKKRKRKGSKKVYLPLRRNNNYP